MSTVYSVADTVELRINSQEQKTS